jgi:hemoglobin
VQISGNTKVYIYGSYQDMAALRPVGDVWQGIRARESPRADPITCLQGGCRMQKRRFVGIGIAVLGGFLLLSVPDESVAGAHLIYERIGYQSGVETVVDYFLANVGGDDRVNGRFTDTDMAQLRGHLIDQVCEATDGPCTYKGKNMREAHAGMGITEAEFAIIAGHFAAAMDQAGVNAQDHAAIMGVLSGMHDDIVGH